jgi:hypothetical protein
MGPGPRACPPASALSLLTSPAHAPAPARPARREGLDALIALSVPRVLTSGGAQTAAEVRAGAALCTCMPARRCWPRLHPPHLLLTHQGSDTLRKLVRAAAGRITILAGGGVRGDNVARLVRETGVREVHSAARWCGALGTKGAVEGGGGPGLGSRGRRERCAPAALTRPFPAAVPCSAHQLREQLQRVSETGADPLRRRALGLAVGRDRRGGGARGRGGGAAGPSGGGGGRGRRRVKPSQLPSGHQQSPF